MASKKLNKKVIVTLTLFVFASMVVLSVLMLRQLRVRDPQYFVEQAKRYEEAGEWKSAVVFYHRAWEQSQDARHLVALGDALLSDGELRRALGSWRNALVNQPDLTEAHERYIETMLDLATLYDRLEDWKSVNEATVAYLDSGAHRTQQQEAFARHANGLALVSLDRQQEGNLAKGEEELRRAVELDPANVTYAIDLADHYRLHDRADEAENLYGSLLERFAADGGDAAKVRVALARYLASVERDEEAEARFDEAVAMAADDADALREARMGLATFLSQRWAQRRQRGATAAETEPLFERTESLLRACIESDADAYEPYIQLAVLYGSAGRHADVVDTCEQRLRHEPVRTGVEGTRNRLNAFTLMLYASQACVSEALTSGVAAGEQEREEWLTKADRYLMAARGEYPEHPRVFYQSGRLNLARGLDREALVDLRAADERYHAYARINWDNKLMLAQTHLRLNEAGAAREVLEAVLDQAREGRTVGAAFWTLYAQVLLTVDELDRALTISDQILLADAANTDAMRIKAAVLERKGRSADAAQLIGTTGDAVTGAVLEAQGLALDGDMAGAVDVLIAALQDHPADPRLVGAAVRTLLAANRQKEAAEIVRAALAVDSEDTQLRALAVLTSEGLSAEQRDEAMLQVLGSLEDGYQRSLELAGFYWRRNDAQRALAQLDVALAHVEAKDSPLSKRTTTAQHRVLLTMKLSIAASVNDEEAMASARDAAVAGNVDGVEGKSVLGLYHMHRDEFEPALAALQAAVSRQPTDALALVSLGDCLQLAGRRDEAGAYYDRAVRINPNDGRAHRGLAMLARQTGDQRAYDRAMAACRRLIPDDPWVKATLLEETEDDDPTAAIARREMILTQDPDDIQNLQRLAQLCATSGEREKADRYHDRLLAARPDDKNAVVMVSNYYRSTDRRDRALEVVSTYAASRPTDDTKADAMILLASHHLHTGDVAGVERTLLEAAQIAETFEVCKAIAEFYLRFRNRPTEALPWLDKAIEQAKATNSPQLARTMAVRIRCLLHPTLDDLEAARARVDELLASFPRNAEGMLLFSEVLFHGGQVDAAIDAISDYLRASPNDAKALFQRALYHHALGRLADTIADLETIKRIDSTAQELRPRLLLARLHRQAGHNDRWIHELESIVEDAPDSVEPREALVAAYIAQARLADAERVVTAQINRAAEAADPRWYFLRGQVAFESRNYERAVADFQRGAEVSGFSAEGVRRVLGIYLQLGRAEDGLEYYRRYAPTEQLTGGLVSHEARLLARAGRPADAREAFRRAMALAIDESPQAMALVTADLMAAWPPAEGVSLFETAPAPEELARANDRILARLYRVSRRLDDAAVRLNDLIGTCREQDEMALLLQELGDVYQVGGQPAEAKSAYERSLESQPDNWVTLNNMAYLLSDQMSEHELALTYARRAVAAAGSADTYDTLGWIHVGLAQYAQGIAALSRAVRLDPDAALSYYHLGEAYRRNGQMSEASDVLLRGREVLSGGAIASEQGLLERIDASLARVRDADVAP